MKQSSEVRSKLDMDDERVTVPVLEIVSLVSDIFENLGCSAGIAREIAEHLADANLCGMESHGLMRTLQYAEQFESG
jgi:LDH2 family malate/lactate/ureidoglycolate dehydrogenase